MNGEGKRQKPYYTGQTDWICQLTRGEGELKETFKYD